MYFRFAAGRTRQRGSGLAAAAPTDNGTHQAKTCQQHRITLGFRHWMQRLQFEGGVAVGSRIDRDLNIQGHSLKNRRCSIVAHRQRGLFKLVEQLGQFDVNCA